MLPMEIAAGQFKAQCLQLMDRVKQTHEEIIITKYGRPVAKLVPVEEQHSSSFIGYMKDSVAINGDIIAPVDEDWEVCIE
jgi:prevent-host-death family protein